MTFYDDCENWALDQRMRIKQMLGAVHNKISFDPQMTRQDFINAVENLLSPDDRILEDKLNVAEIIYHGYAHQFSFEQCLRTGNFFPLPHELTSVNCTMQMVVNYSVAKACGLNPEIIEFRDFQFRGYGEAAGHSLILVEMGDKGTWVIDQTHSQLGHVSWDEQKKLFIVDDVHEKKRIVSSYKWADSYSEEQFTKVIDRFRSEEGAMGMLLDGQRIKCLRKDTWKSKEPMVVPWYVHYDPESRTIFNRFFFNRPLVQNRGVEQTWRLNGKSVNEELRGYYYRQGEWSRFIDATPLVILTPEELSLTTNVTANRTVDKQYDLEDHVQKECLAGQKGELSEVINRSLGRIKQEPKWHSAKKFILVEAWYQHTRSQKEGQRFLYKKRDHEIAFEEAEPGTMGHLRQRTARHARKMRRMIDAHGARVEEHFGLEHGSLAGLLLDPARVEDPRLIQYLALRTRDELTLYQLEHRAAFCDDAADRICFINEHVRPHVSSFEELESAARKVVGTTFEERCNAAYARIFVELAGMMSRISEELKGSYKESLIRKANKYVSS